MVKFQKDGENMITKELIGKIQSLRNRHHKFLFEVQYTKKFHDKNFEYELKENLFDDVYFWHKDNFNNYIIDDGPHGFYKEIKSEKDSEQNIIMLIKGAPLDLYNQIKGSYKHL